MLNERYLHHYFSHLLQARWNLLNLTEVDQKTKLHPEWPTYKKQTRLLYGRYKKENGKYQPDPTGTAGFVDFAVGNYEKPETGIEFSLKYGWSNEEIVYDFLKLLDRKNPFKTSVSLNLIFRQELLVNGGHLIDLEKHINEALEEAVRRLGTGVCEQKRKLHLIVSEIAKDNSRRHWVCNKIEREFERALMEELRIK